MNIKTTLHTIFITVGPTGCGKSTYINNYLKPTLETYENVRVKVLSSDAYRQELIGKDLHKYENEMTHISNLAFKKLNVDLELYTSFPATWEFIIIDATNLDNQLRKNIIKIAKDKGYNIVALIFDYTSRQMYLNNTDTRHSKIQSQSIDRFKKFTLKEIRNENEYYSLIYIKEPQNTAPTIELLKYDEWKKTSLSPNFDYTIIGDLHGSHEALRKLLTFLEMKIENGIIEYKENQKIILLGDLIDKGKEQDILDTLELVYNNMIANKIINIIGNHDIWVYRAIMGLHKYDEKLIDSHFETVKYLDKPGNEKYRNYLKYIVENSLPFVWVRGLFFASHAPCKEKYLGKMNDIALKFQRNFRYAREVDYPDILSLMKQIKNDFSFLIDEGVTNNTPTVFGHVALTDVWNNSNKYLIDTGAVYNNALSSITFSRNSNKPSIKSVKLGKGNAKKLINFNDLFQKTTNLSSLEYDDKKRIDLFIEQKINFISGTVSPADKNEETNELETLEKALLYYKNQGVDKVIIQPKYMGSRCNVYIFRDIEKCYAVTRNGHKIKRIDLTKVFELMINKIFSDDYFINAEMVLLDCELMPWAALGKSLVTDLYKPIANAVKIENQFLDENNFYELYDKLKNRFVDSNFSSYVGKKENATTHFGNDYRTFNNLSNYIKTEANSISIKKGISCFEKQIELFGTDVEPYLLPFNILKIVNKNGTEDLPLNNEENFSKISESEYFILDLSQDNNLGNRYLKNNLLKNNESVFDFWEDITISQQMEGVMVKPIEASINATYAQYIKVRNTDYLHLIYGYDYLKPKKYKKLINKKRITSKLKQSIKEWNLGYKMLQVPYDTISIESSIVQYYVNMIQAEKYAKDIDPRL